MDAEKIRDRKREIIERFGPWTAHCIQLAPGIHTFDEPYNDVRLRRFLQIVADLTGEPLDKLRVLDLACLEGLFGIEFALHGAQVLAIEGREANLAKARFAKEVLALDNLELAQDDVRNFDEERHGRFDAILCLGIFYHLDTPDAMEFLNKIYNACNRVIVLDTNISLRDKDTCNWNGHTYSGTYWREHRPAEAMQERLRKNWASLDNARSFLFTRASLCNLLRHVGFTSVYECMNPYEYHNPLWPRAGGNVVLKDRITLVAIKGERQTSLSSPVTNTTPEIDRPERPAYSLVGPVRPYHIRAKSILGRFRRALWRR